MLMFAAWPRWATMWSLAFAIYFACKILTWRLAKIDCVPKWRSWAYLFAWPGMNAEQFFTSDVNRERIRPIQTEWFSATLNLFVGAAIFWSARYWIGPSHPI